MVTLSRLCLELRPKVVHELMLGYPLVQLDGCDLRDGSAVATGDRDGMPSAQVGDTTCHEWSRAHPCATVVPVVQLSLIKSRDELGSLVG